MLDKKTKNQKDSLSLWCQCHFPLVHWQHWGHSSSAESSPRRACSCEKAGGGKNFLSKMSIFEVPSFKSVKTIYLAGWEIYSVLKWREINGKITSLPQLSENVNISGKDLLWWAHGHCTPEKKFKYHSALWANILWIYSTINHKSRNSPGQPTSQQTIIE